MLPDSPDSVFFSNSGSEAVEARCGWPGMPWPGPARPNIVAFRGSFHGRTIGAAYMTTSGTKFRAGFSRLMGASSTTCWRR